MKNLFKYMIGAVAATVALAALTSTTLAATPTLSPVPTECGSCATKLVNFGLGAEGAGSWSGYPGSWTFTGLSGSPSVSFESWNEGTRLPAGYLKFENNLCHNEGGNFNTELLKGELGVIEGESGPTGKVGLLLEPREGSIFGKCSFSGNSAELTGSYIAEIGPTNTPAKKFTLRLSGEGAKRFASQEEPHQITMKLNEGVEGGTPSWSASASLTTSETVELHVAGRTATFAAPTYAGGFAVIGGAMKFVSKNGMTVICKYMSGGGGFTSATAGHVKISFTGCKGPLAKSCNNGTIKTKPLKTLLAYTYPATETAEGRQTAVALSPETGNVFTEFNCGGPNVVVRGGVMAVLSPLGKASSTFALTMKQSSGVEEHVFYEGSTGGPEEAMLETSLNEGPFQQSGLEVASPTIKLNDGGVETIK